MNSRKKRHKNRLSLKRNLASLEYLYKLKVTKTSDKPLTFVLILIEE